MRNISKSNHPHFSIIQGYCPSCGKRSLVYLPPVGNALEFACKNCKWSNASNSSASANTRTSRAAATSNAKNNITTMIDMRNNNKRYKTGFCHYCDHSKYPNGKLIDPTTDHSARQMKTDEWKCGVCIGEETTKLLSLFGGREQNKK